jgi:glycosyltransferase involved in cell wall biosynthesis
MSPADEPRIAFAIPFHRGLAHLREAIESVLAQTEARWRLLVLDDCGEADAEVEALVADYRDARIARQRNPRNLGMVGNWNRALDLAPADLVTLLHADDRLLPDYAELALGLAAAHPGAVALSCAARIIDARGRARFSFPDAVKALLVPAGEPWRLCGEAGLRALLRGDFVMCPTLCWRRSRLAERRFEAGWRQVQDLELLARLLLEGEELVGTRRAAYAYRRHPESATEIQSESLLRFEEEAALYDRLAARAAERGWSAAARTARRKAIVRLHLGYRAAAALATGRPAAAGRALGLLARLR